MEEYQDLFKNIPNISFVPNEAPFEPLFLNNDLIVTDFTSNVYEMAVIGKPCIYFRPDWKEMDSELKKRKDSSFDVSKRGIGPCTDTIDDFFNQLEKLIKNDYKIEQKYMDIRKQQLPFVDDANACERILTAMLSLPVWDIKEHKRIQAAKDDAVKAATRKKESFTDAGLPTLDECLFW